MLALLAFAAAAHSAPLLTEEYVHANGRGLWAAFKAQHGRNYSSPGEDASRFATFHANLLRAAQLQAAEGSDGAVFGITKFSDMSPEEHQARRGLRKRNSATPEHERVVLGDTDLALARKRVHKDWRQDGAVGPVKDQGQCGSCYAFSTTGSAEGCSFVETGRLASLSEQLFVDCGPNDGCDGGLQETAFRWVAEAKAGDIVTEAAYPYTSGGDEKRHRCKDTDDMPVGATIWGYRAVKSSADAVKAALLKHGPLAISVDANAWEDYTHGILRGGCADAKCDLDHGVVLVGFGKYKSTSYWVLRNSWGADWGEGGYIRVAQGRGGVTQEALYPTFVHEDA